MKIGFLAFENCSSWSLLGSFEIWKRAVRLSEKLPDLFPVKGKPELFIISENKECVCNAQYNVRLETDVSCEDLKPDLLIVPGFDGAYTGLSHPSQKVVNYVKECYNNGGEVATTCTGAFIMAIAGLLEGKTATTHWMAHDIFEDLFPNVCLEKNSLIVEQGRLYMSGGASSFQELMIYLVEKFMSKELAISLAKVLLIDINRAPQISYSIFLGQKQHGDENILKVQEFIESNAKENLCLENMVDKSCLSKRTFLRRFKKATGNTPFVYLQRVKVELAKKLLEMGKDTFDEIAFKIGYEDPSSFRKVFKKYSGISPMEHKKRYSVNVLVG